jgi:hypothetical protein
MDVDGARDGAGHGRRQRRAGQGGAVQGRAAQVRTGQGSTPAISLATASSSPGSPQMSWKRTQGNAAMSAMVKASAASQSCAWSCFSITLQGRGGGQWEG